jgi:hypothetical protein
MGLSSHAAAVGMSWDGQELIRFSELVSPDLGVRQRRQKRRSFVFFFGGALNGPSMSISNWASSG